MNSKTMIIGLGCLCLMAAFFLFKSQFLILLNRLSKIQFRAVKHLQYKDQDTNQDIETELPIQPWLTLPGEKFLDRIIVFVILSFLIFIIFGSSSRILVQFGNAQFSAGNKKLGMASYSLALEFNGDLKRTSNQCYADITKQEYKVAIEHCNQAIEIDKNYATAYFYRGLAYWKLKQYDEAITDFTTDIKLINIATRSYINRGSVYMELNKYDLAIVDFTKSIEINSMEKQAWLNRGLAYSSQGKNDLALADCNKAIELDDKYSNAYFCLGMVLARQGNYDLALTNYDKAIELDPINSALYFYRGSIYDTEQKKDLAIADYTKAIETDPNDGRSYFSRGVIYAAQKKYDLAISDFNKALELDPNNMDIYVWRGNAFADAKKFTQAMADYKKVLEISNDPKKNAYIYCVQGVTYVKMNDFDSAITSLEQGVKLNPTSENDWCKSALEAARQGIPAP